MNHAFRQEPAPPVRTTLVALILLVTSLGAAQGAGVDIITSPDRAAVTLDRALVRAIFSMRLRQWPDGGSVRVFVLPDGHTLHALFCREQLGTYPYVLRSTWDRLVYTGTGVSPEVVGSEKEMLQRVRSTPGAIGYISSAGRPNDVLSTLLPFVVLAKGGAP